MSKLDDLLELNNAQDSFEIGRVPIDVHWLGEDALAWSRHETSDSEDATS